MKVLNKLFGILKKPTTTQQPIEVPDIFAKLSTGCLYLGNAQHQGKRNYQEDSFGISEISGTASLERGVLAVLADGMGGLKNGKNVSETVVSSLLEWFNNKPDTNTNGAQLKQITTDINNKICDAYCRDGKVNAGSTAVEAFVKDGILHWLCIGDSRLYIKREGRLYQINEDHDYLNELLGDAINDSTSVSRAFNDPQKDSLVGCIGNRRFEGYDYSKRGYPLMYGDVLVLCSDGIYNALSQRELTELVTDDAMESCRNIVELVKAKNLHGQDNNTVIIMAYKK